MTKLTQKTRIKIEPSSRDSISSWLDVLTSMLAVPDAQRAQVRDELEDHLRSRVDDLLIVGKPEPEAVQIAVAELGETAELAKLITHAHTRTNPRRKIMNATLIAAALAGMSFGGYTFINGTGAPSTTPSNGGAVPVVVPGETRKEIAKSEPPTRMVNIEDQPLLFTFQQVASDFGYTLNAQSLPIPMVRDLQNRLVRVNGEYTLEGVMQYLIMTSLQHATVLTTEIHGDGIELLTYEESLRRETAVKTYSLDWSNFETAQNVFHTLQEVVGNGQYSQFFTASFIGDQLVVDARPQAHEQVENILSKAKLAYEALALKEKTRQEYTIARIKDEYERVQSELVTVKKEKSIEGNANQTLRLQIIPMRDRQDEARKKIEMEIVDHEQRLNELGFQIEELEMRHTCLRELLIDSEYEALINFLETSPQDQPSASGRHTATISGDGLRAGKYEVPAGLTLSRFIASAGGYDAAGDARVSLKRLGSTRELGTIREVVTGQWSDIVIFADDEIIISAAND